MEEVKDRLSSDLYHFHLCSIEWNIADLTARTSGIEEKCIDTGTKFTNILPHPCYTHSVENYADIFTSVFKTNSNLRAPG